MPTLDAWLHLLGATPRTLKVPRMELMSGRDSEPSVLVGRGEVHLRAPDLFEFTLIGRAVDVADALRRFRKAQDNPYDTFEQFRLIGTDENGIEWAFGWTTPIIGDVSQDEWDIRGSIQSLSTDMRNANLHDRNSAENVIEFQERHPAIPILGGFTSAVPSLPGVREHALELLGINIKFIFRPATRQLAIYCPTAPDLSHPYLENWLAEPFRIIFGQLIYPRLVARNFGDGRAMVDLRPSPQFIPSAGFASLWAATTGKRDRDDFWALYARLLRYIATSRATDGQPHFGSSVLSQFYEEIAQAARGTRWVWALTLASVIEGQTKQLALKAHTPSVDNAAIKSLSDHIAVWQGSNDLKSRAIQAVKRVEQITATVVLAQLRDAAQISDAELASWKSMRNEVMHGTLISPWSHQEEDAKLQNLVTLFHKLTVRVL